MIVFLAKYFYLISFVITGIFFLYLSKSDKKKMFLLGALSGILSIIISRISSLFIYNPRPFVINHLTPLIPHVPDNGFPSDHTLLSMWVAVVVFSFNKKLGILLMLISITVGVARVLALVHHPIDIIGSIVIVIVSFLISKLAISKFLKK